MQCALFALIMKSLLACRKACNRLETTYFSINNGLEKHTIDGNPVTCHLKKKSLLVCELKPTSGKTQIQGVKWLQLRKLKYLKQYIPGILCKETFISV